MNHYRFSELLGTIAQVGWTDSPFKLDVWVVDLSTGTNACGIVESYGNTYEDAINTAGMGMKALNDRTGSDLCVVAVHGSCMN